MSDDQEVEIPDKTAMKLLEGLSCLSNASDLLLDGFNPCHPEIRRWLAGANDDLAAAGLEDRPGDIRHELTTAIEILELHDPSTTDLVTPARIDLLHRRVAIIFRSYFRFSRSI